MKNIFALPVSIIELMIVSATPLIEQRGAVPLAALSHFSPSEAYLWTLIGAIIPAPFILFLMPKVLEILKKVKGLGKLANWYENKALKKAEKVKDNYKYLSIFLFVAIPLPGTGVWTGSTIAALLGFDFKKSLLAVVLGASLAGVFMLMISYGVKFLVA
ncbi:small multi-drug export protein [Vallitalea pronyensis]|uniref:Small multi-drug export protein n=1 Tax=Vallitalea pronyensis TaxID=1348613 RepID=A0A8J8MH17_9FIRM|nr:small multi-drug export protein [Vallitalea pronyensis]QUI21444.1 small multi-drug export protein [Vallitalea pronyensis]